MNCVQGCGISSGRVVFQRHGAAICGGGAIFVLGDDGIRASLFRASGQCSARFSVVLFFRGVCASAVSISSCDLCAIHEVSIHNPKRKDRLPSQCSLPGSPRNRRRATSPYCVSCGSNSSSYTLSLRSMGIQSRDTRARPRGWSYLPTTCPAGTTVFYVL